MFQNRTFIVRVQPHETVARVRAQLLHILYEIGRENHQFRLRFKGQYLRDAFTVQDYGIFENAIVKMVPLSRKVDQVDKICNTCRYNVFCYETVCCKFKYILYHFVQQIIFYRAWQI